MAVISGSNEVIASGASGSWFTSAGTSFILDVDTRCKVRLETRRDVNDGDPKPMQDGSQEGADRVIAGPCSVVVQSVTGRQYRVVSIEGRADVAADQEPAV